MHAFELLLLFIGLVSHVSAQWLRNNYYIPDGPPDFMVGATPVQMEQYKRIIGDRNLSGKQYREQMKALVAQLSPGAQEAYMRRMSAVKESRRKVGLKFLEYVSDLDVEARHVAKQLYHTALTSDYNKPDDMLRKIKGLLGKLSSKQLDQVGDVCFRTVQFAENMGLAAMI